MNSLLTLAALLTVLVGCAHSYLGERYILVRLFRRELPKLFGDDWFTRRTLRFAWHVTTVCWFGFAALMLLLRSVAERGPALWIVATVFLLHALVALVASRGRHLSWPAFLTVALLCARVAAE